MYDFITTKKKHMHIQKSEPNASLSLQVLWKLGLVQYKAPAEHILEDNSNGFGLQQNF